MQNLIGIDIIEFYRTDRPFGFLSNLYRAEIIFENRKFPTNEHAYQFGKFRDTKIAEWVMSAPSPHLVAIIGHGLMAWDIVPNWSKIKIKRMEEVIRAKFTQHSDLVKKLIETNDAILLEKSNIDNFWGIGKKRKGKNMLGKLLMKIRDELINNSK